MAVCQPRREPGADPPSASEGASHAASTPISELHHKAMGAIVHTLRVWRVLRRPQDALRRPKEELCAAQTNEFENQQPLWKQRVTLSLRHP